MQLFLGTGVRSGQSVTLDTLKVINGHLQIAGITGMGKTHQLVQLIQLLVESASEMQQPLRVHVFDSHGDIEPPYCSEVKFSEATPYGYNPLEINPDPDFGGVRGPPVRFVQIRPLSLDF